MIKVRGFETPIPWITFYRGLLGIVMVCHLKSTVAEVVFGAATDGGCHQSLSEREREKERERG